MAEQKSLRTDYATLKTEARNPRTMNIDKLETYEMLKLINDESRVVFDAVDKALPEISEAVDLISTQLQKGHSLIYIGAGTSGRLGVLDAAECPPTFGVEHDVIRAIVAGGKGAVFRAAEGAEDNEDLGASDVIDDGVKAGDVLVGISASGGAPYVCGALKKAKELGAHTIGLSCNPGSKFEKIAGINIVTYVGAEVITGSSRMKAGTAQKLVLNMLSTGAMIKTGKVRENLMINVKPTNEKLYRRSVGIIMTLSGADERTAKEMLDKYGDISKCLEEIENNTEC